MSTSQDSARCGTRSPRGHRGGERAARPEMDVSDQAGKNAGMDRTETDMSKG